MTIAERLLLIEALEFYREERRLDDLPKDSKYKYYDYDEDGNVTYNSTDVIDANNMDKLLDTFS